MTLEGYNQLGSRSGSPRAPLTPRTRSARIALSLAAVALVLSAAALAGSVLGAAAASSRGPRDLRRVHLRSWLTSAGPTLNKNECVSPPRAVITAFEALSRRRARKRARSGLLPPAALPTRRPPTRPPAHPRRMLLVAEEELDDHDLAALRAETEDRVERAVADMEQEEESRARVVEALVDRLVASEAEPLSAEELRALRERWQEVGGVEAEDEADGERASMADDYAVGVGA